jgi:hypothetical protein
LELEDIMLKINQKIPERYRDEFFRQQTVFIKNRVYLFCILAIGIYFSASLLGIIINPGLFKVLEIFVGLALAAGAVIILYVNSRIRTLRATKINAYLFTALLLALLTKLSIGYADVPLVSASIFVFSLFLVSMTIPWTPLEVVPIWAMHAVAFTISFLCVKYLPEVSGDEFSLREYLDGILFLTMAFWLSLVVRRKETGRDIENFVLLKDVEDKNSQMSKELEWATRIHKTIIPDSVTTDRLDIAVKYLPVYYIGGDYVRFNFLDHDRLVFIISDITGHGVPAALLVNRMHTEFERLAKEGKEPGALLKELNEFIKEAFEGADMYLSAFCGLLDLKKMRLLYSNYGHPAQYVYNEKESRIYRLPSQTSLLGVPMNDEELYQSDMKVDEEDKILLFTDGIIETTGSGGEEYGSGRLEGFLKKHHELPPEEFNASLLKELDSFKEGSFKDDICIMNIGIKPHPSLFELGSQIFKHQQKEA